MLTASVRAASADHCRLALNVVHVLHESDGPPPKTRFPEDVDVVLASDLVFTLSGVLNGVKIAPDDLLRSQLAQHLVDYFQVNAKELGLTAVSSMYLGDNGLPNLKVVSSRGLTPDSELRRVHVTLVGIDLNYVWRTNSDSTSNSLVHPFSTHLSLPFKMLLDNVICRFVKWQLVRRYPLIFGPWCQQLHIERAYFDKIFRSIAGIIARSPNPSFRKKCNRMLKTMQEHHSTSFTAAAASLATYFGSSEDSHEMEEDSEHPVLTDEEAFSLSMEIRYRTCLRRPQFKGTTRALQADDGSDDDELSQDQSLLTPETSQRFDEDYLWQNPAIANSFQDSGFDFPLVSPSATSTNIDSCSAVNMGIAMEYQDPFEFWSDPDGMLDDADDLLSLSSDDELDRPSRHEVHSQDPDKEVTDAGFSLVTPESPPAGSDRYRRPRELGLAWDVNMDSDWDESHAEGSPDAPLLQTRPTQIESLSPPADDGEYTLRQGTTRAHFPGLSSMHCQADDLELSFDSDSDQHDRMQCCP
ncbi:hypothetical protein B0H16DRAFT_1624916 [Mycena metata]|uniref:Uncharacterized protein n=1 Tax=Mycena metata TaxID=1033252 RepID=A0AAD7H4W2_9AGAR|nr:hypothetical protein B0H16DRAFT_1624916 [Mycena metata]